MNATTQITKTGRIVNAWGISLPEVSEVLGCHDVVYVDGVAYYTHDFGGYVVGSRTATSVDYGGNDVGRGVRTAPQPLDGMAAPQVRGARPTKISYGDPEIISAGH